MQFFRLLVLGALVGGEGLSAAAVGRGALLRLSAESCAGAVATGRAAPVKFSCEEDTVRAERLAIAEETYWKSELRKRRTDKELDEKRDVLNLTRMNRGSLHCFVSAPKDAGYKDLRKLFHEWRAAGDVDLKGKINERDTLDMLPIYLAARAENVECAALLMEYGAVASVVCGEKRPWTPLDVLVTHLNKHTQASDLAYDFEDDTDGFKLIQDMAFSDRIHAVTAHELVVILGKAMIEEIGLESAFEMVKTDSAKACLIRIDTLLKMNAEKDEDNKEN